MLPIHSFLCESVTYCPASLCAIPANPASLCDPCEPIRPATLRVPCEPLPCELMRSPVAMVGPRYRASSRAFSASSMARRKASSLGNRPCI